MYAIFVFCICMRLRAELLPCNRSVFTDTVPVCVLLALKVLTAVEGIAVLSGVKEGKASSKKKEKIVNPFTLLLQKGTRDQVALVCAAQCWYERTRRRWGRCKPEPPKDSTSKCAASPQPGNTCSLLSENLQRQGQRRRLRPSPGSRDSAMFVCQLLVAAVQMTPAVPSC